MLNATKCNCCFEYEICSNKNIEKWSFPQLYRYIKFELNTTHFGWLHWNLYLYYNFVAVVMSELTKLFTSLIFVFYEQEKSVLKFIGALRRTITVDKFDTLKVCVPSLLYVIQNNLLYISAANLNPVTNQVGNQFNTCLALTCSYWNNNDCARTVHLPIYSKLFGVAAFGFGVKSFGIWEFSCHKLFFM